MTPPPTDRQSRRRETLVRLHRAVSAGEITLFDALVGCYDEAMYHATAIMPEAVTHAILDTQAHAKDDGTRAPERPNIPPVTPKNALPSRQHVVYVAGPTPQGHEERIRELILRAEKKLALGGYDMGGEG